MQKLEYPLPKLALSCRTLALEAGDTRTFVIKNSGGGQLSGRIISPEKGLVFEPVRFCANKQIVTVAFRAGSELRRAGQSTRCTAQILTTGGDSTIDIELKFAKTAIPAHDGTKLANLQGFYEYSEKFPAEAAELFGGKDFHLLLTAIDYPFLDAYKLLVKEPNRARAIDDFFVLSKLKEKSTLIMPESKKDNLRKSPFRICHFSESGLKPPLSCEVGTAQWDFRRLSRIEHIIKPKDTAPFHAVFALRKTPGYFAAEITKKPGGTWLTLPARIENSDFDGNIANLQYTITPALADKLFQQENIRLGDYEIILELRRPLPFRCHLPREGFSLKDAGILIVESSVTARVEVFCKEQFVQFERTSFEVLGVLEIPFVIKPSPLLLAQMLFRNQPALFAELEVSASYPGKIIKRKLQLTAGEL